MTTNAVLVFNDVNTSELAENNTPVIKDNGNISKEKIYGTIFLSAVTGISAMIGFGSALASARKQDPKFFQEGVVGATSGSTESGVSLALRALGRGSVYAIGGCGILFYGIWKLSGADNAQEFRQKMGSILPRIPKNDPPRSRTEFDGLTDLLTYLSKDWDEDTVKSNK